MGDIFVQFSDNSCFTSRSVAFPMRLRIPRDSFLVFPTPSTLHALLRGVGAALAGGVVDGVSSNITSPQRDRKSVGVM